MAIQRNIDAGTISLSQTTYAKAVIDRFGMADARSAKTPAEPGQISMMEEGIMSPEDIKYFRSAAGSLLYLSRGARPDITLGDGTCEEHVQARSEGHDQAKTSAQVFKRDDAHRDNIQ